MGGIFLSGKKIPLMIYLASKQVVIFQKIMFLK